MTIFGIILVWLVTALVLVFSIYIALDSTKYTHNKFLKWLFTGLLTIMVFIVVEMCALCAFAMCDMAAHDKGELRYPLYNSIVSKELYTIGCGEDFNMIISKDENGETILQTIIDNEGVLEVIDMNTHNFNFYLTDTETPRIEYYSKVKVEPSSFRWIFNDADTINIDLSNINTMYKKMKLKGDVYLPRTTNINQNLIIF
jgi:hypothetical protein